MRTFISLNLSDEKKREVFEIQNNIKGLLDSRELDSVKWEGRDKFHQTIFFLGETAENMLTGITRDLEKIKSEINFDKINFVAKGLSAFPNLRYPRVLIVELENPDGNAFILYDKICGVLTNYGFTPDKKFHPHITLGRVKRDRKVNLTDIKDKIKFDLNFSIGDFCLMESRLDPRGSLYKEIKRISLTG